MIFHPDTKDRDHGLLDAFVDAGGTCVDTPCCHPGPLTPDWFT